MRYILFLIITVGSINTYAQTAEEYLKKGLAKFDLADYKGAIEDGTKAIALNPKYGEAYFWRAKFKYELKEYKEAIQDYSKAIEINPKEGYIPYAYYYRGECKGYLNDKKGACSDITKSAGLGNTKAKESINNYCK